MKTERMKELKARMKKDNKKWIGEVINKDKDFEVVTHFNSENHTFENVLHKVELDLMTNLHQHLQSDIIIKIKEVEK